MTRLLRKRTRNFLAIAMAVIFSMSVAAQTRRSDAEREVLARAVQELELIDEILKDAERRAEDDARLFLDYQHLRKELSDVRDGISEYVSGQRLQPRAIEPVSADYVRLRNED